MRIRRFRGHLDAKEPFKTLFSLFGPKERVHFSISQFAAKDAAWV